MDEKTRSALAELNRTFYARFADDFARTRRTWPPGFDRILPHLRPAANVLDIGCGNGRLLAFLVERGWAGRYVGVDNSAALLAIAQEDAGRGWTQTIADEERSESHPRSSAFIRVQPEVHFVEADLLQLDSLPSARQLGAAWRFPAAFDAIACLAVLHHVPGAEYRARLMAEYRRLLAPGGVLIVSTWQFLAAPRLRARILPWSAAGLRDADVEPEDYLIAWGAGMAGQRYCASIGADALCGLAGRAGLMTVETFYADGHEGNLNLYGVFSAT
jgi:SAM-dependent methyltransferase